MKTPVFSKLVTWRELANRAPKRGPGKDFRVVMLEMAKEIEYLNAVAGLAFPREGLMEYDEVATKKWLAQRAKSKR